MMKELLAAKKLKITKPRLAILSVLSSSSFPLTAEAVEHNIDSEDVNLSTVYRTLNLFVDVGIAKKEINAEKENVYSLASDEDSHVLVCVKCHKKTKLEGCPYHEANQRIEEKTGFAILDHSTEIYGVCPQCRKNDK